MNQTEKQQEQLSEKFQTFPTSSTHSLDGKFITAN